MTIHSDKARRRPSSRCKAAGLSDVGGVLCFSQSGWSMSTRFAGLQQSCESCTPEISSG